jgi:hypothetical protein
MVRSREAPPAEEASRLCCGLVWPVFAKCLVRAALGGTKIGPLLNTSHTNGRCQAGGGRPIVIVERSPVLMSAYPACNQHLAQE